MKGRINMKKKIAGYDDGNRHGNDAVADKRIGGGR